MTRASLLWILVGVIYLIFALNTLALVFSLYYILPWYDIPMHYLGGLWVSLATAWLVYFSGYIPSWVKSYAPWGLLIAGTIAVGIGWEIFEYAVGARQEEGYAFDTALDIVMDTLGALTGAALLAKKLSRHE